MRETKEPRRYLTTTQAARRAHVSPSTLLRAVQTKKLKAFSTPGGHFRVDPASLEAFLQSSGMPGEKKKVLLWRMSRQERETLLEKLTRDADFSLSGEAAGDDKPALIILEVLPEGKRNGKPSSDPHKKLRRWCGLA